MTIDAQPSRPTPAAGTRRWRRLHPAVRIAVLVLSVAFAIWLGVSLFRAARAALALYADLSAVRALAAADLQTVDLTQAAETLHSTRIHLEELHSAMKPFLWAAPAFAWVPRYGADIRLAPTLLDTAVDLSVAGDDLVQAMWPVLERAAEPQPLPEESILPLALETLVRAQPQIEGAWTAIQRARASRAALDRQIAMSGAPSPRVAGWLAIVDRALPPLEQGVGALAMLSAELGAAGDGGGRTYMVLVQNEDELRATGGFISAVALIRLDRQAITLIQVEDSYAVDDFSRPYPEPPAAVRDTMSADLWVFRDANWSPDFPTAARAALELYAISRPAEAAQVDGVIALDQHAIRFVVDALEPLEVAGQAQPITGENVIQAARQAWAPGEQPEADWWLHRKDFYEALLQSILRRSKRGIDRDDLFELLRASRRALNERHLLVHLRDERAGGIAHQLSWDGALGATSGDYLMVVHSNVGFNKANALVEERLQYTLDLRDPLRPAATLTITLQHPGPGESPCNQQPRYGPTYEEMMQRCYWDYVRVYCPAGTQLISASRHPIAGAALLSGHDRSGEAIIEPPELGRAVFANLILVQPGETVEVRFDLALPPGSVVQREDAYAYRLFIQKQPGTRAVPIEVRLLLAPGTALRRSSPQPDEATDRQVTYSLTLDTDRSLVVEAQTRPE